ncbi:MAG: cbb3-type cytochrome c oxidase subunit 3 [Candidatus Accumulibacter sp. UW26]|jgi:cytochrome c oxidase cbb3-type subunit 4
MDINDLRSIITVVSLLTFLGVVWWAYGVKGNKQRFEEASMLPFTDEEADWAELGLDRNGQRKAS